MSKIQEIVNQNSYDIGVRDGMELSYKWISIKDRLPPKATNVLCNIKNDRNKNIQLVLALEDLSDGTTAWLANFIFKTQYEEYKDEMPQVPNNMVTHWQPLPEPPDDPIAIAEAMNYKPEY